MRIESITLHRVVLALREPIRAAHGVERERDVLIVELRTDVGTGWGECAALGAPTYTAEFTRGAFAVVADHLGPALLGAHSITPAAVQSTLAAYSGHPMAKAALELAVLDAALRSDGISLAAHSGATASRVPSGVVVGLAESTNAVVESAERRAAEGYLRIKLKIAPGRDVDALRAVRRRLPDVVLAADANGSYRPESPPPDALDDLALAFVEQPFAAPDLDAHARLARRWQTPICLDESVVDAESLDRAADRRAGAILNLKPGRVGGHLAAVALHERACRRGLGAFVGGMFETAVGRSAALALAARPGMDLAHDLAASDRYYDVDLAEPFALAGGYLDVPQTPGLGRVPDPAVLAERTVDRVEIALG